MEPCQYGFPMLLSVLSCFYCSYSWWFEITVQFGLLLVPYFLYCSVCLHFEAIYLVGLLLLIKNSSIRLQWSPNDRMHSLGKLTQRPSCFSVVSRVLCCTYSLVSWPCSYAYTYLYICPIGSFANILSPSSCWLTSPFTEKSSHHIWRCCFADWSSLKKFGGDLVIMLQMMWTLFVSKECLVLTLEFVAMLTVRGSFSREIYLSLLELAVAQL